MVELPIYLWFGRRALGLRERSAAPRRAAGDPVVDDGLPVRAGLLHRAPWYGGVNLVSHPLLWFGLAPAGIRLLGATAGVLAAEGVVTMGEGLAVAGGLRARRLDALMLALLANAVSFSVGLALTRL
jgi:hypothetical protein